MPPFPHALFFEQLDVNQTNLAHCLTRLSAKTTSISLKRLLFTNKTVTVHCVSTVFMDKWSTNTISFCRNIPPNHFFSYITSQKGNPSPHPCL